MNTPFFTVIVASFNAGEKLKSTLKSILAQEFGDYEVIVKDAGSTDGSLLSIPQDSRIRLICRKDEGIYAGMNQAIRCAMGEYIYFLNCGDSLHDPLVLTRVHEYAQKLGRKGSAILYGDVIEMRTGQRVAANPEMSHFAMYRYLPCHQACFYTRSLFRERGFDTQYRVRADYEHFLWSVMKKGASPVYLDIIIADYEGGGFSETKEGRKRSSAEHTVITQQYFTKKELSHYRAYMILTLQPLREKIAGGRYTAAAYDGIKNAIYRRKSKKQK